MKPKIEDELKMLLSYEQFRSLVNFYKPEAFNRQCNNYYASASADSYFFRIREINGTRLFTLKSYQDGRLYEYEKELQSDLYEDEDILQVLKKFNVPDDCHSIGKLVTYRSIINTGYAELCFDINIYNGTIDYEVEYEVQKEHDSKKAFSDILKAADIDFVENKVSKYKRFCQSLISSK